MKWIYDQGLMTQTDIAKMIGFDPKTVSDFCTGKIDVHEITEADKAMLRKWG